MALPASGRRESTNPRSEPIQMFAVLEEGSLHGSNKSELEPAYLTIDDTLRGAMDSKTPQTGLTDLPTEIVQHILNDVSLQPKDLYNLATLSKYFNLQALPLYFKAYRIPAPQSVFRVALHGGEMDYDLVWGRKIIAGLEIATYLKPVPVLICNLRFRPDSQMPYKLLHLHRFRARLGTFTNVIRRLHSLAEVYIIGDEEWLWETSNGPLPDSMLQDWTTTMGDFMNVILEKGCTSLELLRGRRIVDSYSFHPKGHRLRKLTERLPWVGRKSKSRSGAYLNGLEGQGWEFRRPEKAGYRRESIMELSEKARMSSNIRHLYLHSTQFLLPPHLSWTLSAIRCSKSLISLSFSDISMEPTIWEVVLPLVASALAPQLKELAFGDNCEGISAQAIMNFLRGLDGLEHLKIHYLYDLLVPAENQIVNRRKRNRTLFLPSLKDLTAPFRFSENILRSRPSCPRLQRWNTFYTKAELLCADPAFKSTHAELFNEVCNMLREDASSEVKISITMILHAEWRPLRTLMESMTPIQHVNHLNVRDLVFLDGSEDLQWMALWLGKVFPDITALEADAMFRDELRRGVVPGGLNSFLKQMLVNCPLFQRLIIRPRMIDVSRGIGQIQVSHVPEPIYHL